MRAAEIMTKDVQTVPASMPAAQAWELMRRKRIHHLVVAAGSEIVGVLSERDAGGRSGSSLRARSSVAGLMTTAVVTVAPDATIRKIANLMRGRTIGCVPVVQGRRLMGIVTISDLLDLLGRGVGRPAKATRHDLHYRVPHRRVKRGAFGVW
jgi:acetoin utilization protein AcuB